MTPFDQILCVCQNLLINSGTVLIVSTVATVADNLSRTLVM